MFIKIMIITSIKIIILTIITLLIIMIKGHDEDSDDDLRLPCSKSFIFDNSSRALQATIYHNI